VLLSKKRSIPGLQIVANCTLAILLLLAIALRVSLYHVVTSDYTVFLSQWYDFIQTHGGFAALRYNFSNYNPPYLYLLALTTYLPIPKLVAIKTLSVVFDGVLGLFTYLILSLRYKRRYAAIIGALVVLFAPTIVINSAVWGQSDAIYTAFCLGSLYFCSRSGLHGRASSSA
jgi:Gpi18-like mannosyltransferase